MYMYFIFLQPNLKSFHDVVKQMNGYIYSLETSWIGLSREENKDWSWINGDQPNVSHWKYEPKEYDTSQKCASVTLKFPYRWYEGFCYEAKPFICQFREGIFL